MIIVGRTAVVLRGAYLKPGAILDTEDLESLGDKEITRLLKERTLRQVADDEPEPKKLIEKLSQPGKWTMNPEEIGGLSLDKLNAMLIERDGDPEATKLAAIKKLSSDFDPKLAVPGLTLDDPDA